MEIPGGHELVPGTYSIRVKGEHNEASRRVFRVAMAAVKAALTRGGFLAELKTSFEPATTRAIPVAEVEE